MSAVHLRRARFASAVLVFLAACGSSEDDAGFADAAAGDAGAARDVGSADVGSADLGAVDLGAFDTGAVDTGAVDTGASDTGPNDTGTADADPNDADPNDGAVADTGAGDAGVTDLGPLDVGCDFFAEPIRPPTTGCNDRAAAALPNCVPALLAGAPCDTTNVPPNNVCAPPNICNLVSTATISRCVVPAYDETAIASPTYIDACATGTQVVLTDLDDGSSAGPISIPFSFDMYGVSYTEIWPTTNGYAVLGNAPANATFGLPAFGEGVAVAPFWTDLAMDNTGARICWLEVGTTELVIEWVNAYRLGRLGSGASEMRLTFELILHAGSDQIDFVYQTLTPTTGATAPFTRGFDAHIGVQDAFAADWAIHDGPVSTTEGIRFSP